MKWLSTALLCLFLLVLNGQNSVDLEQLRIDQLDGLIDQKITINVGDQVKPNLVFIEQVDSLQNQLKQLNQAGHNTAPTTEKLGYLLSLISFAEIKNYTNYYNKIFTQLQAIIAAKNHQQLLTTLNQKPALSVRLMPFFYNQPNVYQSFLNNHLSTNDYLFLNAVNQFKFPKNYTTAIEKTSINNPSCIKPHLYKQNAVKQILQQSLNDTVQFINQLLHKLPAQSEAYLLAGLLFNDSLCLPEVNQIIKQPQNLFNHLIFLAKNQNPIAKKTVAEKLTRLSLETINQQQNLLKQLTPIHLYFLMLYGNEEISALNFNAIHNAFISQINANNIEKFITETNQHKLDEFLALLADYNQLNAFCNLFSNEQFSILINQLLNQLTLNDTNPVKQAANLALVFSMLKHPKHIAVVETALIENYNLAQRKKTQILLGLIISSANQKCLHKCNTISSIGAHYTIPNTKKTNVRSLYKNDSLLVQYHFFYNDDDGRVSYQDFIKTFNNKWEKTGNKWVDIYTQTQNNRKQCIVIYKPHAEHHLNTLVDSLNRCLKTAPQLIVHRGHSYYVNKTIKHIGRNTKLVFLGSCGGYRNISRVLNQAPEAQIISSKQIGSKLVNTPLLNKLTQSLFTTDTLQWNTFWQDLETQFSHNPNAQQYFANYIPPNKNQQLIFIKRYYELTSTHP